MALRVGINGFGRMGRLGLRAGFDFPELTITRINEIATDAVGSAHLLEFDSVHGRWDRAIEGEEATNGEGVIRVDGRTIRHTTIADPAAADWGDVDLVIEASGRFRTREALQPYFDQGVKKVIVAAPVKDPEALNVVVGVNDHLYESARHHLLTAASCTTNCLAPVVKVMHEGIGIRHASMTTIHDMTNTQTLVDKGHKDPRRARACNQSLIPTSTGSARAIGDIFPELDGRINGHAVRVPLLNASLTDLVFEAERPTTEEEVNGLLKAAADGPLAGILGYEERPLVSVDYKDDTRSSIVDAPSTLVVNGTQVKVMAWYDNEIGYVNRMMELARQVARTG
ncbi:MAG: ArsJ-associated glyceraldehyde-3-phosphate dehydrogenase [Pseudomonadota bacterium]